VGFLLPRTEEKTDVAPEKEEEQDAETELQRPDPRPTGDLT